MSSEAEKLMVITSAKAMAK